MSTAEQENIRISQFDYHLPEDKIAQQPLAQRDQSKFLVYRPSGIEHRHFFELDGLLPEQSHLIFNNTKVIAARLFFRKDSGAQIQIFLLEPVKPFSNMEQALHQQSGRCVWQCMIGNARKWKPKELLSIEVVGAFSLSAELISREPFLVQLSWPEGISFADVLAAIGKMPLPPYIKREATLEDSATYQTVYAREDGAVAAPTAGLHFTPGLMAELQQKHTISELTLHVGAGTFKPVTSDQVWQHEMHREAFMVSQQTIQNLLETNFRIAVGTTSLRTLESLYWCGVNLAEGKEDFMAVHQHQPYLKPSGMDYETSLHHLLNWMQVHRQDKLWGSSSLMIMPGYTIRSVEAIITNFHMPKSTLLLLIAAMIGEDWKLVYRAAMENNYRFLSYGDSSLLFKK